MVALGGHGVLELWAIPLVILFVTFTIRAISHKVPDIGVLLENFLHLPLDVYAVALAVLAAVVLSTETSELPMIATIFAFGMMVVARILSLSSVWACTGSNGAARMLLPIFLTALNYMLAGGFLAYAIGRLGSINV